jgi:hypothetical protein
MDEQSKARFEGMAKAVAEDVTEVLDKAVDGAADLIGGGEHSRLIGGAAIGALAALVLPVSLIGGALLGAGYAAYRQKR